MVPVSKR